MSLTLIATLLVTCFIAITGYCFVVLWPKLSWSLHTSRHPGRLRPQYQGDRLRHIKPTTRRTLPKR